MDFQSPDSFAGVVGALLVLTVLGTLVMAIAMVTRSHFAKSRATKLIVSARNMIALGIFARDDQDSPGPVELLGEAYRLQRNFHLKAETIGLRDDEELDELISRAIRGNAPAAVIPASEMETLPEEIKVQVPNFGAETVEDDLTSPDLDLAGRIADAHADSVRDEDAADDYLKSCADMSAGLHIPINRNDLN